MKKAPTCILCRVFVVTQAIVRVRALAGVLALFPYVRETGASGGICSWCGLQLGRDFLSLGAIMYVGPKAVVVCGVTTTTQRDFGSHNMMMLLAFAVNNEGSR